MLAFFVEHEWRTQLRSIRFRGLAAVYVIAASLAPIGVFATSRRLSVLVGPGAYDAVLLISQPLLTAVLAVGLSIDGISRERDEGSFAVLSVAPISSTGYFLRRWLAIVSVCVPVTLIPTAITAALSIRNADALPLVAMFGEAWLVNVLPALLAASIFAIALGTITGRTVLAVISGILILTVGLGLLDEVLFYFHRAFHGPGSLFGGSIFGLHRIEWLVRGYGFYDFPSDAGYAFRSEARTLLARGGIGLAVIVMIACIAVFYLRRTKRDLRPWKIPATHQLRTMLQMFNRMREEFSPDQRNTPAEGFALLIGAVLAVAMIGYLVRSQSMFAALAQSRFESETHEGPATDPSVVVSSADIDARIDRGGNVVSSSTVVARNDGAEPRALLSFEMNPLLRIESFTIDRGEVVVRRMWQRVDLTLRPPLAAGEARTLRFRVAGTPGDVTFALQPPGNFTARWYRYRTAKEAIYLTDLSQSTIDPSATEVRMHLRASDVAPVMRYTKWELDRESRGEEGFTRESLMTSTSLHVRLRHDYRLVADSCGAVSGATLDSRCVTALPEYEIFGGPHASLSVAAGASLAYIPAHAATARLHAQSLATAVRLAAESWPSLHVASRVTFVENPHELGQREYYAPENPSVTVRQMSANGALFMIPEGIFTRMKAVNPNIFAAAILSGTIRSKRHVPIAENAFFRRVFAAIAVSRLGLRRVRAVEPGALRDSGPPDSAPLLSDEYQNVRLARVLTSIEYRVGEEAFIRGIDDFVNASGVGDAKEFLHAIARRGGVDLTRTYEDYFTGSALPKLTLVDVAFHHAGDHWDISGAVKNEATGEAFVPIALRTGQGTQWQTIRVDGGQRVPFAFTTPADPRAVQLDPDQVCYRYAAIGTVDSVEYRGQS